MHYAAPSEPLFCWETGTLMVRDHCFALRCADGSEFWLEMDQIPNHLIDQAVQVEGKLYRPNLVSVERIGPA